MGSDEAGDEESDIWSRGEDPERREAVLGSDETWGEWYWLRVEDPVEVLIIWSWES